MKLVLIPIDAVDDIWPLLAQRFNHACKRSQALEFNSGVLWQMARSGDGFLIIALADDKHSIDELNEADIYQASIWRFDAPHDPHSFRCMMLFGNQIKRWYADMLELITNIATVNGARRLVTTGRSGWLRYCAGAQRNNNDYEVEL